MFVLLGRACCVHAVLAHFLLKPGVAPLRLRRHFCFDLPFTAFEDLPTLGTYLVEQPANNQRKNQASTIEVVSLLSAWRRLTQ